MSDNKTVKKHAVDLDGTLAYYDEWLGPEHIGDPVPLMVERIKQWLEEGDEVVIFTARAADPDNIPYVDDYIVKHIGVSLPITNEKDPSMTDFFDDRAYRIEENTGKIISGVTMEKHMTLRYNQVSLEGLGFGVTRLTSDVARNLNSFLVGIADFIGDKVNHFSVPLKFDFISDKKVDDMLSKTNYISISVIEIYVPPGMNSTMNVFLESLRGTQNVFNDLENNILVPAKDYFSKLLGTPETMTSVIHDGFADTVRQYQVMLQKEIDSTSACYSTHSARNKRPHGEVFKRNGEWKECCELLSSVNTDFIRITPKKVADVVTDICSVLDRLSLRMRQSPDVYQPTGIISNDIADIAMALGKIVEVYASYSFVLQSANACMKDNVAIYKKVLSE